MRCFDKHLCIQHIVLCYSECLTVSDSLLEAAMRDQSIDVSLMARNLLVEEGRTVRGPPHAGVDAEVGAACWLDEDRLAVSTTDESTGWEGEPALGTMRLGVWSLGQRRWLHRSPLDHRTGTLLARSSSQVVSLNGHPRLLDAATGRVIAAWPDVAVPEKAFCYGVEHLPTPVAAVSPDATRLAVAQDGGLAIIELPEHQQA